MMQWNAQVLSRTSVKVQRLYIAWFLKYSGYSECLPLKVMSLLNMMPYWMESGITADYSLEL